MNELTLAQLLAQTGSPGNGQLSDLFLITRNNIGYAMTLQQLLSTNGGVLHSINNDTTANQTIQGDGEYIEVATASGATTISAITTAGGLASQAWVAEQNYITSAALNGYATQLYVNNKITNSFDNYSIIENPATNLFQSGNYYNTRLTTPIDFIVNPIVPGNYLVVPLSPAVLNELWGAYVGSVELTLTGNNGTGIVWNITISLSALCCNDRNGAKGSGLVNIWSSSFFSGTIGTVFIGDTIATAGLPAPFTNIAGQSFIAIQIPTITTPTTGVFNLTTITLISSNPRIASYLIENPITTVVQFTPSQIVAQYSYANLVNINTL